VFHGYWKEGEGRGVVLQANGDTYTVQGEWHYDNEHGLGVCGSYEGAFNHGQMHGLGYMKYTTGNSYHGYWKDDKRHGAGTLRCPDGSVWHG
jgi:hypothetical protein